MGAATADTLPQAAIAVDQVEQHEERRRGDGVAVGLTQAVEPASGAAGRRTPPRRRDERARGELRDGRRDVAKAPRVVAPVTAQQPDALAVLVRQHPPAVDLLLVDPAVAVEGRADERGGMGVY
jgi:hypothetical protein